MEIGCIILAAGCAERFGGGKLTALLAGIPVLERTVRNLPEECFTVVTAVVSDEITEKLCARLGTAVVRYPGGTVSDSIREGMTRMADMDACLFVNGDQPMIRPESIRLILRKGEENPGAIVRLGFAGTPGSPVLFPRETFRELSLMSGDTGGRQLIRSGKYPVITVDAAAREELDDIDTPEELARAEQAVQGRQTSDRSCTPE